MDDRFGKLLRAARKAARKTLSDLAGHLDLSIVHLSEVEVGHRHPLKNDQIIAAATYLNTNPAPLLDAATAVRGKFVLDSHDGAPSAEPVGAALSRKWPELKKDEAMLEKLRKLLEGME